MSKAHSLKTVRLFVGLEEGQLDEIDGIGEYRSYDIGETIFEEGDEGTHVYCLLEGRVEISVKLGDSMEQVPVHTATSGSVFGEFILFESGRRSATARATKPATIFALSESILRDFFARDPRAGYIVMDSLCRILVGRVAKTTKELRSSLMW